MRRLHAFKYELRPGGQEARQMARFTDSCRFAFNKPMGMRKANYEADSKLIRYLPMAEELTAWRNGSETLWLKDAPVHSL